MNKCLAGVFPDSVFQLALCWHCLFHLKHGSWTSQEKWRGHRFTPPLEHHSPQPRSSVSSLRTYSISVTRNGTFRPTLTYNLHFSQIPRGFMSMLKLQVTLKSLKYWTFHLVTIFFGVGKKYFIIITKKHLFSTLIMWLMAVEWVIGTVSMFSQEINYSWNVWLGSLYNMCWNQHSIRIWSFTPLWSYVVASCFWGVKQEQQ